MGPTIAYTNRTNRIDDPIITERLCASSRVTCRFSGLEALSGMTTASASILSTIGVPHSRVDVGIENVNTEVEDQDDDRGHEHRGRDQRQVEGRHALDIEPANTR